MVDETEGRAVRRRAQVLIAGDTARLAATVLVVAAGDALAAQVLGWWALAALLAPPLLVALMAAVRSARAGIAPRDGVAVRLPAEGEGCQPAPDRRALLARRVIALAGGQGMAAPQVRPWPGPVVNAYGLGSGRRAVLHVGDAAAGLLDHDALDAVLLHELHHLRRGAVLRADAWRVATAAATTLLVPVLVPLLALSVLVLLRYLPFMLLALLGGPAPLGRLVWRELGPPVELLLWPTRLRAAATHRRDLLADLSAAAVVGPAAVLRALVVVEAAAPAPAEVDAARAEGSPSTVAPRTGRRCTVPLDDGGEGSVRSAALRWSLWRRARALALLGGAGDEALMPDDLVADHRRRVPPV